MKQRLDQLLVQKGLVPTRSQAESYIRLEKVVVDGRVVSKPGALVSDDVRIKLLVSQQYVSRAALKLESISQEFNLDFRNKTVLDIGSSTGGFTQFALLNGAKKVIAIDVGTNQLHPNLRSDDRIELHEQTDFRDYVKGPIPHVDIVLIDVSFISIREILAPLVRIVSPCTIIVAMVKPQFEAGDHAKHKGVIKNESMRRSILKEFEGWTKEHYQILNKADSKVSGERGNTERFYLLRALKPLH